MTETLVIFIEIMSIVQQECMLTGFDIWFVTILSDRMTAHFLTEKKKKRKKKENGILYASRFEYSKHI